MISVEVEDDVHLDPDSVANKEVHVSTLYKFTCSCSVSVCVQVFAQIYITVQCVYKLFR